MKKFVRYTLGAGLVFSTVFLAVASSHREAPLISADPLADNTDVYAFVSPDAPNTVTLIANWIPLEAPDGGPNFYKFGDDVLYRINIDNDGDANDDIVYEFRFKTRIQNEQHVPLQHRTDHVARRSRLQRPADLHGDAHRPPRPARARPRPRRRRRSTSARARRRTTTRSRPRRSTRCRTARRCSPVSATIRSSSISDRSSTCSACGRSIAAHVIPLPADAGRRRPEGRQRAHDRAAGAEVAADATTAATARPPRTRTRSSASTRRRSGATAASRSTATASEPE